MRAHNTTLPLWHHLSFSACSSWRGFSLFASIFLSLSLYSKSVYTQLLARVDLSICALSDPPLKAIFVYRAEIKGIRINRFEAFLCIDQYDKSWKPWRLTTIICGKMAFNFDFETYNWSLIWVLRTNFWARFWKSRTDFRRDDIGMKFWTIIIGILSHNFDVFKAWFPELELVKNESGIAQINFAKIMISGDDFSALHRWIALARSGAFFADLPSVSPHSPTTPQRMQKSSSYKMSRNHPTTVFWN